MTSDKYLSIYVLGDIKLKAFKNKDKTEPKHPDFKGDGVAVWISTPKPKEEDIKQSLPVEL